MLREQSWRWRVSPSCGDHCGRWPLLIDFYALNITDLGKLVQIFIVFWKPSLKSYINIQRKKRSLAHKVDHRDGKSATRHRPSCWNHTRRSLLAARVGWYARDLIGHRNHQHRFVLLGSLVKGEAKNQETAIVYRIFMWWFYHQKKSGGNISRRPLARTRFCWKDLQRISINKVKSIPFHLWRTSYIYFVRLLLLYGSNSSLSAPIFFYKLENHVWYLETYFFVMANRQLHDLVGSWPSPLRARIWPNKKKKKKKREEKNLSIIFH